MFLLAVSFAVLAVAKACDQPTLTLTPSQKGSEHWSGANYAQPGTCRILTIAFPSNSTLLISVTGKARAANVDTFTIADRLDTLLESSEVVGGSWRVPNGLSVDWQNAVTVRLDTGVDQAPAGDITISYEVVEMLPQFKPTGQVYSVQLPAYQASVVEPLSLLPDNNITLAFSSATTTEQLDFAVISEVALTAAQKESLVNVFIVDGQTDVQRPRCRLLSALVTPNACRTGNAAYILSLDDLNSNLLTFMTVAVTRKSFSNTPIQYKPIFLNKANTDTSITWKGQGSTIVPLLLKYYSDPSDGVYVKSVDYTGPDALHVFTGGASKPNTVLDLFYTTQNESALWRDFVLETPWACRREAPSSWSSATRATTQVRLVDARGNERLVSGKVERSPNSNGVLMSSRHPLRTRFDVFFERTMRTGGKPSNYTFWSSTAFNLEGSTSTLFGKTQTMIFSAMASPNGLSDTATDFAFSYHPDANNAHIGFLLRYYITPVKIAPTASLLAGIVFTLLAIF